MCGQFCVPLFSVRIPFALKFSLGAMVDFTLRLLKRGYKLFVFSNMKSPQFGHLIGFFVTWNALVGWYPNYFHIASKVHKLVDLVDTLNGESVLFRVPRKQCIYKPFVEFNEVAPARVWTCAE